MAAVTSWLRFVVPLLGLAAQVSVAASPQSPAANTFSDQVEECVRGIKQILQGPLSNPPDFVAIHDVTKWLGEHLPKEVSARFSDAGQNVSQSLRAWEQHHMIHAPFWNIQALKELLNAQAPRFRGIAGCKVDDDLGVGYEIVQDQ